MEEFIKIERDKLYSVIAKYRPYDKIGMLDDLSNDLFELSETEVSTYTEDEFLKEKHHFLIAKAMGKISKEELKILEEMTALFRSSQI